MNGVDTETISTRHKLSKKDTVANARKNASFLRRQTEDFSFSLYREKEKNRNSELQLKPKLLNPKGKDHGATGQKSIIPVS
jgi:hypothetical protein